MKEYSTIATQTEEPAKPELVSTKVQTDTKNTMVMSTQTFTVQTNSE